MTFFRCTWPMFTKSSITSCWLIYMQLFYYNRIRQRLGYILISNLYGYVAYICLIRVKNIKILISKKKFFLTFSILFINGPNCSFFSLLIWILYYVRSKLKKKLTIFSCLFDGQLSLFYRIPHTSDPPWISVAYISKPIASSMHFSTFSH